MVTIEEINFLEKATRDLECEIIRADMEESFELSTRLHNKLDHQRKLVERQKQLMAEQTKPAVPC